MKTLTLGGVLLFFLLAACSDISSQTNAPADSRAGKNADAAPSGTNALAALIGDKLVNAENKAVAADVLRGRKVGIYFSAHWCGPCRAFSPTLVKFYNDLKKAEKPFEVVLVNFDRTEKDMLAYMKDTAMPWPALPFDSPRKEDLARKFGVQGIPMLVILSADGKVLSTDGRGDVMRLGLKAFDKWE